MIIALLLTVFAFAQDPTTQEQVNQLEQIVKALERVHPDIVAEVKHEECERHCHVAISDAGNATTKQFVECIKAVKAHKVDINSNDAIILSLKMRYPHEMARQDDPFWNRTMDAARIEYLRQLGT